MHRAGIVTVAGKPNAGKSTLLNRIVGQKLAITSAKPQSTRDRVVGIRSDGEVQMVVFDTPGLLDPRYALQRSMRGTALRALEDADVVIYVADATQGTPPPLAEIAGLAREPRAPVILALNKADRLLADQRADLLAAHPEAFFLSARTGDGVEPLLEAAAQRLPEGPPLYPEDEISTQTMRFFASEMVRETALEQLEDELPYSVACEIEEYREDGTPVYIRATLHVERESQKGIVIGAGAARIRAIGQKAREKIERFIGAQVYLDLHVKVLPNWRRNATSLRRLGYRLPEEHSP